MPLAPEPTPEQVEVRLSAAQVYENYLKYKQEFEEPDRSPWVIVWMFATLGSCGFSVIVFLGIAWLCGWIP